MTVRQLDQPHDFHVRMVLVVTVENLLWVPDQYLHEKGFPIYAPPSNESGFGEGLWISKYKFIMETKKIWHNQYYQYCLATKKEVKLFKLYQRLNQL